MSSQANVPASSEATSSAQERLRTLDLVLGWIRKAHEEGDKTINLDDVLAKADILRAELESQLSA